jgi:2-methylcitrate dehydratase PrpD
MVQIDSDLVYCIFILSRRVLISEKQKDPVRVVWMRGERVNTIIERLTTFVIETCYKDIPEEGKHRAKQCILDTVGVTLAGSTDPIHKPVMEYLREVGGKKQSTVIGFGTKTSAPHAAFANGVFGHVLDYDDYTFSFIGHPTVVVAPVILSLGEVLYSNGKDLYCLPDRNRGPVED